MKLRVRWNGNAESSFQGVVNFLMCNSNEIKSQMYHKHADTVSMKTTPGIRLHD